MATVSTGRMVNVRMVLLAGGARERERSEKGKGRETEGKREREGERERERGRQREGGREKGGCVCTCYKDVLNDAIITK